MVFQRDGKGVQNPESVDGRQAQKAHGYVLFRVSADGRRVGRKFYTSGDTATSTGGGQYSVKANRTHFGDAIALKVVVGTDEKVAKDKKSNVNKWLRAVSKPARGFWYHIFGLLTTPIIIGSFMLGSAIYRDYLNVVRKSCVKKAKKTYKMCEEVVVF